MSQKSAKVVFAQYEANSTGLRKVLSVAEQLVFVQKLDSNWGSEVPGRMDDGKNCRNFSDMVTADKMATFGNRGKLQK